MKLLYVLPTTYLVVATYAWFDFTNTNPDGLANLGLMMVVVPVTILGLLLGWFLGAQSFVLLPERFGYLVDHAIFFLPSAAVVAIALWYVGRWLDRRRS